MTAARLLKIGIKIDPVRAHLIRAAFELRANGMPYKSVAKEMKKQGLVSNTKLLKPISTSRWEQIFANKFYIGTMKFETKEYEHHYDTFIEKWLWDKCQDVKEGRKLSRTKYNTKSNTFLFKKY